MYLRYESEAGGVQLNGLRSASNHCLECNLVASRSELKDFISWLACLTGMEKHLTMQALDAGCPFGGSDLSPSADPPTSQDNSSAD
jgi:hypothetical protein